MDYSRWSGFRTVQLPPELYYVFLKTGPKVTPFCHCCNSYIKPRFFLSLLLFLSNPLITLYLERKQLNNVMLRQLVQQVLHKVSCELL